MSEFGYDDSIAWWDREVDDDCIGRSMFDTVRDIERRQKSIHDGNRRHARIYAGYLPSGLADGAPITSNMRMPFAATKNLIRSVCDVGHAMMVKNLAKSSFVTTGADWKVQMQAEDLDQFMVGAYQAGGLYPTASRSFLDSEIFGTGGWKYVTRGRGESFRVMYERILMDDVVVDEEENRVDCFNPPNVYHRLMVRTDAIARKFGVKDDTLKSRLLAASKNRQDWPGINLSKDHSMLVEAFHVDYDEPKNNRRLLAVDGCVLKSERWQFPFQPFTFLWWALPITGFYGDGIAYRQYGRQERITYMHRWIQTVLDRFATPTAWVDPIGGPPTLQMSNDLGRIVATRRPPVFQKQELISGELWHWLDKLETDGYEDEGMAMAQSGGQTQPGVYSAPAQREATWNAGQRFVPVSQRWEHAVAVDTAKKTTAFYKKEAAKGEKPRVQWADRKLLYTLDWPDLEDNAYMIRPEASSLDSLSPSARMQSALELAQTGWIGPEEGRELVAHPDLKRSDELGNSPVAYAKWVLRKLWRGEHVEVDEKAELVTLQRIIKQGRLLAITKGVAEPKIGSPEALMAMDTYLDSLDAAMQAAQDAEMQKQLQMQAQAQAALNPTPGGDAKPAAVPFQGAPQ